MFEMTTTRSLNTHPSTSVNQAHSLHLFSIRIILDMGWNIQNAIYLLLPLFGGSSFMWPPPPPTYISMAMTSSDRDGQCHLPQCSIYLSGNQWTRHIFTAWIKQGGPPSHCKLQHNCFSKVHLMAGVGILVFRSENISQSLLP